MAIAFVGAESGTGNDFSTASPSFTGPAGSADELLLLLAATDNNHAINTVPSGWTQVGITQDQGTATSVSLFRKFRSGSETAFGPFTNMFAAAENGKAGILAFSGVDLTTPLDVAVQQSSSAAATTQVSASITPTTSGVWVVSLWGTDPGADPRTCTADDHTGRVGTGPNFGAQNALLGFVYAGSSIWTSGAVTHQITYNASQDECHFIIALRPAAAAGGHIHGKVNRMALMSKFQGLAA